MGMFKIKLANGGKKKSVFFSGKNIQVEVLDGSCRLASGTLPLHIDEHGMYFAPVGETWHEVRRQREGQLWQLVK